MVVAVGETLFDVKPKTEPTPLSIDKLVGVPAESVHERVAEFPFMIVEESTVKELMMGAAGVTVTFTDLVAVPVLFVAVRV